MVCSETTKTELQAGTWTNSSGFFNTKNIFLETDEVKAGAGTNYIILGDDDEEIIRSSDSKRIHAEESCALIIFATNITKRNNLVDDIESIFVASSKALKLLSGKPSARRTRYIREFIINLTTKS